MASKKSKPTAATVSGAATTVEDLEAEPVPAKDAKAPRRTRFMSAWGPKPG